MITDEFVLPLPGLREDNPRDFLAALGLLRCLTHLYPEHKPCLFWSMETGRPALSTSGVFPANWSQRIFDLLLEWNRQEESPFSLGKIEDVSPGRYRTLLAGSYGNPEQQRFLGGLASQVGRDGSGRRSELIIESASRSVLNGIATLLNDHREPLDIAADFEGTSTLREVRNTSRWHPAEYQSAAYVAADPQTNKHRDRVSLNVLAAFGLTFYPPVDSRVGRRTPGTRREHAGTEFSWPVWAAPLLADEVSSLLVHPLCHLPDPNVSHLILLGVHQLWRTRKFNPDGHNDYFSTARPVF